jgi:hypothetical protein
VGAVRCVAWHRRHRLKRVDRRSAATLATAATLAARETLRAYPNNPAVRTAITPQAKRLQFFG